MFLTSALERLLEDTLRPILRAKDVLPSHVEERKTFFERRTGRTIAGTLRAKGFQHFERDWRELIGLRNQIAHGHFIVFKTMKVSTFRDIRHDALPAFACLMAASLEAARGSPRQR